MSFESGLNGFFMIYHSTQSDDYLWWLVLRGKQKETRIPVSVQVAQNVPTTVSKYTKHSEIGQLQNSV